MPEQKKDPPEDALDRLEASRWALTAQKLAAKEAAYNALPPEQKTLGHIVGPPPKSKRRGQGKSKRARL